MSGPRAIQPSEDERIEEAAARWDAHLRSPRCSNEDRSRFKAWEKEDPRHAAAFARLQSILEAMRGASEHPQLRALRDEAAAGTGWRKWWAGGAVAAAFLLAVSLGSGQFSRAPELSAPVARGTDAHARQIYQTALNERTLVTLEDGSTVSLNSNSKLIVHFTDSRRSLDLVAGQALFRVFKDPARPFVVRAGERQVVALGTVFDVRVESGAVQVTLLEGRVAVRAVAAATNARIKEQRLVPNQQLVVSSGAVPPIIKAVDTMKVTGWTEGRVYFEDTPLAQAVDEMNRYSASKIVIGDPGLAAYRVNGMFRTGTQTSFVGALEAYFPIEAHVDRQNRILLNSRENNVTGF